MLFGIAFIIFCFGSFILLIWWGVEKEKRESRKPLSNDLKSHYFIKEILDITNNLKSLETSGEIIKFLHGETDELQSDYKPSLVNLHIDILLVQKLGVIGAVLGEILFKNKKEIENKIWKLREIQSIWVYYLCRKIINKDIPRKERKEIEKNIGSKLIYLLNLKTLFLTKQSDIKNAWMMVLKDKVLTNEALNQLWGHVRKMLFPEHGGVKL